MTSHIHPSRTGNTRLRNVAPERGADSAARVRAALSGLMLFIATCSLLGILGSLIIEDGRVAFAYSIATIGFGVWIARETYRGSLHPEAMRSR